MGFKKIVTSGSRKKKFSLNGRSIKRGDGGLSAGPLKKTKKKIQCPNEIKLEGGGGGDFYWPGN